MRKHFFKEEIMKITKTKSKFNKISEDLIKSFNSRSKEKSSGEKSKHKSQIIDKEKKSERTFNKDNQNHECSSDIYLDFIEYIKLNYIDSLNKLIQDEGVYYGPQVALDFHDKHHHENGSSVKGVLVANVESLLIMKDIINSILDKKLTTISEILYESSKRYEEDEEYEDSDEDSDEDSNEDEDSDEEEYEDSDDEDEYDSEDDEYDEKLNELNELNEFDNYAGEQNDYFEEDD